MALHSLASDLGMTVGRLIDELTMREFRDWVAYYAQRDRDEPVEPDWESMNPSQIARAFNIG